MHLEHVRASSYQTIKSKNHLEAAISSTRHVSRWGKPDGDPNTIEFRLFCNLNRMRAAQRERRDLVPQIDGRDLISVAGPIKLTRA